MSKQAKIMAGMAVVMLGLWGTSMHSHAAHAASIWSHDRAVLHRIESHHLGSMPLWRHNLLHH